MTGRELRGGSRWLRIGVLGVVATLVGAASALPEYEPEGLEVAPHVKAFATKDADWELVQRIANVIDIAAAVCRDELKLAGPDEVQLYVNPTDGWFPGVVTDRKQRIFAQYSVAHGLGEEQRLTGGVVGYLCQATAELYNPHRLPGVERWLSSTLAVPAVAEQLGAEAWGKGRWGTPYDYAMVDGLPSFKAAAVDPKALHQHPQLAAAAALDRCAEKLTAEAVVELMAQVKADGADGFRELRELVGQAEAELVAAFDDWEALQPHDVGDEGWLISSYEELDQLEVMTYGYNVNAKVIGSWATDGNRSLEVVYGKGGWPRFGALSDDWRFRDWSSFSSFEFDIRNPGDSAVDLSIELFDTCERIHAYAGKITIPCPPSEVVHAVLPLFPLPNDNIWVTAPYFDGHFRLAEVCGVVMTLREAPEPVTLCFDNFRLMR